MSTPKVEGTAGVARALERFSDDLGDLRTAETQIAAQGAAAARTSVPRRTGRLAASIRANANRDRAQVTVGNAVVRYARYVAEGTRYMPAAQFPRRVDQALDLVAARLIAQDIDRRIRKDGLA